MITVIELLSHPTFRDFQLVSGSSGLYNVVTGTGIFEWESSTDVDKTFMRGEFVVTTLSQAKGDLSYAEKCLRTLILKGVSGIAIKTVYFQEVPEEITTMSEKYNTPIFLFADTYFDDIIYTIKNALITRTLNANNVEKLNKLLNPDTQLYLVNRIAREINPFFFDDFICCVAYPNDISLKNEENLEIYLREHFNGQLNSFFDSSDVIYSLIVCSYGVLIIYTVRESSTESAKLNTGLMELLGKLGISQGSFMMGLSNIHSGLDQLGIAIKESIYANTSCIIDCESIQSFGSIGLDQFLMPTRNDLWVKEYYNNILKILQEYDADYNSNLMETLVEYIKSEGDIQLTSKKCFLHNNTIRYRLGKIKEILNIEQNADFYPQMYVFIRLYQIYNNL